MDKIHFKLLRRKLYFVFGALLAGALLLFVGCSDSGRQENPVRASARQGSGPGRSTADGQWNGGKGIAPSGESGDQTGSDVVEIGAFESFSGTLHREGSEWYLQTEQGRYLVHLGNRAFVESTGAPMEEGASVELEGFVEGDEIAVASLTLNDEEFRFRSDDGQPLWAGRGNRQIQGLEEQPEGSGDLLQDRGSGRGRGGKGRGAGNSGNGPPSEHPSV